MRSLSARWSNQSLACLLALLLPVAVFAQASTAAAPDQPAAVALAADPAPVAAQNAAEQEAEAELARIEGEAVPPPAAPDSGIPDAETAADPEPPAAATDPATQAEQDYADLYGTPEPYDPVADPSMPPPAELPVIYDPWEPFNRRMHRVNDVIDRRALKPLAKAYVAVVPRPVRLGIGNFFSNLGQPVTAVNSLLQGKPQQAGQAIGRFAVNATLGVGGLFDPATKFKIPQKNEDFGQTLGVWGWKQSRYLELPLFGPRTVRDVVGMVGDSPLAPIRGIEEDKVRVALQGLQIVDIRTQLLSVDSMREGATDDYLLTRDAWLQRRNYQIHGDTGTDNDGLPDYLREDTNPTFPVDTLPVPGG